MNAVIALGAYVFPCFITYPYREAAASHAGPAGLELQLETVRSTANALITLTKVVDLPLGVPLLLHFGGREATVSLVDKKLDQAWGVIACRKAQTQRRSPQ